MNTEKRGRGRPKGSGRDDGPTLNRVADMIVADRALRPTTAMKRALPRAGDADIRRLQTKWKVSASTLMAEALKRAKTDLGQASILAAHRARIAHPVDVARALQAAFDYPAMRSMREFHDSPTMKALRELQNNPALRALSELQNGPAMTAVRELQNNPVLQAVRELQNNSAVRAMREFQSSPVMQAIHEIQQTMERVRRRQGL